MIINNRAKFKLFNRDKWKCLKCGSKSNLTIDHVIPVSKHGAKNGLKNRQTLCYNCNQEKGDSFAIYTKDKKVTEYIAKKGYNIKLN